MKIGVYAGSFCPITKGHVNAIEKAAKLVDKLFVVVGVNCAKNYALSSEQRLLLTKRALAHLNNVEVVSHDGMMTDFCKQVGASVMVKSIRNAQDLQQVVDLCDINAEFWQGETVFVVGDKQFRHVSSSLVRELASLGQDISAYVPQNCAEDIAALLAKQN